MILLFLAFASLLGLSSHNNERPFRAQVEMGALDANGGSHSDAYNVKLASSLDIEPYHIELLGHFLRTRANGEENNRSWDINPRYRYEYSDLWDLYIGHKGESDIYNGYTQRDSEDIGAQYRIEKNTDLIWLAEAGYRYSNTRPTNIPARYENYLRLYTRAQKVFRKQWILEGALEYLPNLTTPQNDLATVEAGLTTILTSTFALKLSSEFQYQESPYASDNHFSSISSMNLVAQF